LLQVLSQLTHLRRMLGEPGGVQRAQRNSQGRCPQQHSVVGDFSFSLMERKEGSRVSRERQVLLIGLGVVIVGAGVGEHLFRRLIERRYREALEGRRVLELQFGEALANQEQLKQRLAVEQRRSKELSEALASNRGQLEEAVGRLSQASQGSRELRMRLAAMQQQMDQLQGELSLTLQERQQGAKAGEQKAVELERIIVSDAATPSLQGRVVSIHPEWNFVVIDLGWSAVKVGDTVSIFRKEQLLAKVRVERVQEGICAASVLPDWQVSEVHVNDLARVL